MAVCGSYVKVQQQESELQSSNPLPITSITKLRANYSYFTHFVFHPSWPVMGVK